ncbi:MAG: type II toxin-antitoxin system MqsA family antitoxin [Polyangiaceae bacterium]|nr:type II toxin-antitoxin system MqsA family antitoxin [Polyangiaceae bacterium]
MKTCTNCGSKTLKTTTEDHEIRIGQKSIRGVIDAIACERCGEVYFPADAIERLERDVATTLVRTGNVDGDAFRFVRHVIGMQAKDLAALLGVAAETVSRWEQGQRDVDRLAWLALAGLLHDRVSGADETRRTLEAVQHPTPMPNRVKIAS